MKIPRANTKFDCVPEGYGPRSDGNTVTPNATVASQRVQSTPLQPPRNSTRSRQHWHSVAHRWFHSTPTRCWLNREEWPASSSRNRAAAPSIPSRDPPPEPLTRTQRHGTRLPPDAAELPPTQSQRAAGEVEADGGELWTKNKSRYLHCPVGANCRHARALL